MTDEARAAGGNVVSMHGSENLLLDNAGMADQLRRIAARLEAGDYGQIARVGVLLESPTAVATRFYGRPTNRIEGVGILEYAKHNLLNGDE